MVNQTIEKNCRFKTKFGFLNLSCTYNGDTKMMKKTKKKRVVKKLLLCLKAYSTESLSIRVTQLLHFVTSHRNEHSGEDTTLCHSSLSTGKNIQHTNWWHHKKQVVKLMTFHVKKQPLAEYVSKTTSMFRIYWSGHELEWQERSASYSCFVPLFYN